MLNKKLIKICGITCSKDIAYANELLPEFVGFVLFYPKSKRNIGLKEATRLLEQLNKTIYSVAVTVSPTVEQVKQIQETGFHCIQIHGKMSDAVYEALQIPIFRAFNVTDTEQMEELQSKEKVRGYVFDAKTPGSGKTFDWNLLKNVDQGDKLLFLAGGIGEHNVKQAIAQVNPDVIDVSSAVENPDVDGRCGGKNKEKMRKIIRMVHDEE